jgi:hypothetical protein
LIGQPACGLPRETSPAACAIPGDKNLARAIPALTALAFFGMRSGMKKLFVICLFLGVFGLWTKADEKGQTEKSKLIHIAADVGEIARGSIDLCEEEFPALDAKFKGDKYNDLVARLRTPMKLATGLPEYLQKNFPGFFESGQYESVDAGVFWAIDVLRALDGVLLAEALAGSAQSEKLILSYELGEASLFHLSDAYKTWLGTQTR